VVPPERKIDGDNNNRLAEIQTDRKMKALKF
jgi:hypothetical protein